MAHKRGRSLKFAIHVHFFFLLPKGGGNFGLTCGKFSRSKAIKGEREGALVGLVNYLRSINQVAQRCFLLRLLASLLLKTGKEGL